MKLLLTGAYPYTQEQIEKLKVMGHEVVFVQQEKDPIPDMDTFEYVVCNGLFLYHSIEKFAKLRHIQLISAGLDRVPMDYIKEHQIKIYNAGSVYSVPMAEFALSGVLTLYKRSRFFLQNQKEHRWEKHRNLLELNGKTVLIVGCGSVGTQCAKRFFAFGCKVIGVDMFPTLKEGYEGIYPISRVDELLPQSDVVVLTVPLTEETRHLFDKERIANMKDGAVLVNIARGAVVEADALIDALKSKLLGAVLDVFEEEPLAAEHPLWGLENVILTPHNSFVGEGNNKRMFDLICSNLERWEGKLHENYDYIT